MYYSVFLVVEGIPPTIQNKYSVTQNSDRSKIPDCFDIRPDCFDIRKVFCSLNPKRYASYLTGNILHEYQQITMRFG
jgi:hypothetical protein